MHKDVSRWFEVHPKAPLGVPSEAHHTDTMEAGGFLYLSCWECMVLQTVDEVDAGLPVAPARHPDGGD